MSLGAIWEFIVGDSRRAPVAVAIAIVTAIALVRTVPASAIAGAAFACIIAMGLAAAVFERT